MKPRPRIYELGGALPRDIRGFADVAGCPDAYLPADPRDMKAMLAVLVEAERCAIRTYTEICNMTFGKDHRTYDIALAILHEDSAAALRHIALCATFHDRGYRVSWLLERWDFRESAGRRRFRPAKAGLCASMASL